MSLYVLKFGGSSVATTARIKNVADIVSGFVKKRDRVVVVTSAMQGVTNNLIELTKAFSDSPFNREYDAVISSGEQVAAGLLALALNSSGFKAKSMNAWQLEIKTKGEYSESEIIGVDEKTIFQELDYGIIPVVTGFQGISKDRDICTIGRGGSDATACSIARAIGADECLIYTDVDGVYTADPRVVLNAQKLSEISYDDMIELASWGAKVLQTQSVIIAKEYGANLRVLSSFSDGAGTNVSKRTKHVLKHQIVGIAHNFDYFTLRVEDHKKAKELIGSFIAEDFGSFLISKNFQNEAKEILTEKGIDFEIDNDVGLVTIVRDLNGESSIEKETLGFIDKAIENINVQNPDIIIRNRSISIRVPFQQTIPFVNELHKLFFDEPEK